LPVPPVQPPIAIPAVAPPIAQAPLRRSVRTRTAPIRDDDEQFSFSSYGRKGKQPADAPPVPDVPVDDAEAGGVNDNEQPLENEGEQAEVTMCLSQSLIHNHMRKL